MVRSIFHAVSVVALAASSTASPATPNSDPVEVEQQALMSQILDQAMAEMFKTGEQDPKWNDGGVDPLRALQAKPGHVLLDVDKDGERTIIFYTDKPVAASVPDDWELMTEVGRIEGSENSSVPVEISEFDKGHYMVSRTRYERVGDAFCSSAPIAAQLYKRKGAPADEMGEGALIYMFRELMERAKTITVCERHEVSDGVYRSRYFLKDGRSLPFFDGETGAAKLVPQRPTAEMLEGSAAATN